MKLELKPEECKSITEVRNEIDRIDAEIIHLLATRLGYVREVVKYKDGTAQGINAAERRAAVIRTRSEWAAKAGLNPEAIGRIYNELIEYFIEEEMQIVKK